MTEIKNKEKELSKGAGKGSKSVDKARNTTQKHIELLGQHTASWDSAGGSVKAGEDPYVIHRGVYHRLNKQVQEENANRQDLLSVQSQFSQFEAHVVQTVQQGMGQFSQVVTHQADSTRSMYGDMISNTQRVDPGFEWNGFVKRNNQTLIDPNEPQRTLSNISFPNQNHSATKPLIAGSLEKKGKVLKRYDTGYYVVTPSKYLHEFKTDDVFAKDPVPENSLYLPDCMIGAVDGVKFNVRGKDASKGGLASKMSRSHEYAFKAHTAQDAQNWHNVISTVAGQSTNEMPEDDGDTVPNSPVDAKTGYNNYSETGRTDVPSSGPESGFATSDRV